MTSVALHYKNKVLGHLLFLLISQFCDMVLFIIIDVFLFIYEY